jgi:hypothetical protein
MASTTMPSITFAKYVFIVTFYCNDARMSIVLDDYAKLFDTNRVALVPGVLAIPPV